MGIGNISFSCFLIGDGSLIIQCSEILKSKNHDVLGIVSSDEEVVLWCNENNIPNVDPEDDFLNRLKRENFDFLFSINNPLVLERNTLSLPRKCTINYHDSLLPEYAGVNATSWAIMNCEKEHGITWHIVDETLDTGNILKQVSFAVNEIDTAALLNMKCYEVAINSFSVLLDELALGAETAIRQDPGRRSYFSRYKRPYAASLINFKQVAANIGAFVNALEFGKIRNPVGTPKIKIANDFFIVGKIEIVHNTESKLGAVNTPGVVTAIAGNSLRVATADNEILITEIYSLTGIRIAMSELAKKYGVTAGYRISTDFCDKLDQAYCATAKHELFWVNRLKNYKPVAVPYETSNRRTSSPEFDIITRETHSLGERYAAVEDKKVFLLTAFAIYFSRIVMETSFDLGFEINMNDVSYMPFSLFAKVLPISINFDYSQNFQDAARKIGNEVKAMGDRLTFCKDIVVRYPELKKNELFKSDNYFPIKVGIINSVEVKKPAAGNELTFFITEDGAKYVWAFNRQALDDETVRRMDANFGVLLHSILDYPLEIISNLPLLTAEDIRLLTEWRGNPSNYPKNICIHELFERQAARVAHDTAVIFENNKICYGELNAKANMLGNYLKKLGIGVNSLVGIYIDRSLEMIIAILAILKAGGAYVPIDPDSPEERVSFMVEDTSMRLCLTLEKYLNKLSRLNTEKIALDTKWKMIAEESPESVTSGVKDSDLAYVMYTSGSTGNPKGVMIIHESVVALLDGCEVLVPSEGKVVGTSISTYSFDTSVWEIFSMLCYGRELHIIRPELYTSARDFAQYLVNNRITTTYVNPILIMDTFYQLKKLNSKNYINYFKTGLEAKKQKVLQAARDYSPDMLIANLYGPTETTVCGTFYEFDYAKNPEGDTPIGKPMPNYEAYIVDRNLQPLPPGLPGELLIGGVCVAPGYLNRPSLTKEKFIPNPIKSDDKYRLYRTGDMVRFLSDGNMEFIGRMDNQLKIHGYRIEPGEIESVLSLHPDVIRAIVTTVQFKNVDKRIVAYIVPREKKLNLVREFKEYLIGKLPHYMIPSYFVILDKIPLQINGKVNFKALPMPDARQDSQRQYIAPRNYMESHISNIWRELFMVEDIGVQDNFFELGGYSLLAVRLFNAIEKVTGVRIPLSYIFEISTIEEQVNWIKANDTHLNDSLIIIRASGSNPPLFCMHAIDGEIIPYGNLSLHLGNDQPIYGLRLNLQDLAAGTGSIAKLATKYIAEIRKIQANGPYYLLGYSFGGIIAFEMAQQLNSIDQEVAFLGLFDTINPQFRPLMKPLSKFQKTKLSFRKFRKVPVNEVSGYLVARLGRWYRRIISKYFSSHTPKAENENNIIQDILIAWRDAYVPTIYPGRITLFKAKDEPMKYLNYPDELGWNGMAKGGIVSYVVSGDHLTLVNNQNIGSLGEQLIACLRETKSYTSSGFSIR